MGRKKSLNARDRKARRRALLELFNSRCAICGKSVRFDAPPDSPNKATVDHVVPLSRGGTNCHPNLQLACFPCNQAKADRLESE